MVCTYVGFRLGPHHVAATGDGCSVEGNTALIQGGVAFICIDGSVSLFLQTILCTGSQVSFAELQIA